MAGIIIAGERSGAGKTTVTLALLAALKQRYSPGSATIQAFKVGPDYIDPMFHRYVTDCPSYNLDPIITSETYVQRSFGYHSQGAAAVVVEGVMGLFDGADGGSDIASTAHIARLLNLPVLLVIDCSRLSRSVAAIVHGYRSLDPCLSFAGVVLNRVGSDRHLQLLKTALCSIDVPVLGVLRREDAIAIPDRHLGLVPAAELPQLQRQIERLADLGQRCFDWHRLAPWLPPKPTATHELPSAAPAANGPQPRIALAADAAFSFYYPDSLEVLKALGAQLVPWSPLQDEALPENVHGLYFGGGFPEMFAAQLSSNQPLLQQLRQGIALGLPTYAECGGLMYLCRNLIDFEEHPWPMVGVLPTDVSMQPRLTLGYRCAQALQPSPLMQPSGVVWGHEFHRSAVTSPPQQPLFSLGRYGAAVPHAHEGWRVHQVHASYVHLHWGEYTAAAARFVATCRDFAASKGHHGQ